METSLISLAQSVEARQVELGRMESLINASPVAMFTCKAGGDFAATFVTAGVKALWGYEPEDFLRQPRFWADRIHPDDSAAVYKHLAYVLERDAVENDAIDATFTLQQAKSMAAPGSLFRPCARRPA